MSLVFTFLSATNQAKDLTLNGACDSKQNQWEIMELDQYDWTKLKRMTLLRINLKKIRIRLPSHEQMEIVQV